MPSEVKLYVPRVGARTHADVLSPVELRTWEVLKKAPEGLTTAEVAREMGRTLSNVRRNLDTLVDFGLATCAYIPYEPPDTGSIAEPVGDGYRARVGNFRGAKRRTPEAAIEDLRQTLQAALDRLTTQETT
jgi:hypothetical protein